MHMLSYYHFYITKVGLFSKIIRSFRVNIVSQDTITMVTVCKLTAVFRIYLLTSLLMRTVSCLFKKKVIGFMRINLELFDSKVFCYHILIQMLLSLLESMINLRQFRRIFGKI